MEEYAQIKKKAQDLHLTIEINISNFLMNTKPLRKINDILPSEYKQSF
jgi:hypothetical protein